jgi:hypothetical protein
VRKAKEKSKSRPFFPDALKQINAMLDHSSCSRGAAREEEKKRRDKKRGRGMSRKYSKTRNEKKRGGKRGESIHTIEKGSPLRP